MYRVITIGLLGLAAFLIVGTLLTMLQVNRQNQALLYSVNNFRELSQFSELYLSQADIERAADDPRFAVGPEQRFVPRPLEELERLGIVAAIPAGTAGRMDLAVEERLSWIYTLLPTFNQKRQATEPLYAAISPQEPWNSGTNRPHAATELQVVTSFGRPLARVAGEPAYTQIVGLTGLGIDPASWAGPRAGCFHYDKPRAFPEITDGLSHSILIADTNRNLGPWLQGGPSTARGLDLSASGPRPIGFGGQFGGNHPEGAILGFADHSVRIYTDRTDRGVLANLVTIAGGDSELLPGE